MDIAKLRDEVREYLASHPKSQTELAEEIGVSHSWLNKFLCGHFENFGIQRLQVLVDWVARDKKRAA